MTVSKMVCRMVALRLLRRARCPERDGRTWYRALTKRAKRALRVAYRGLYLRREAEYAYSACFEFSNRHLPRHAALRLLEDASSSALPKC